MAKNQDDTLRKTLAEAKAADFVMFRFTDTLGKLQQFAVSKEVVDEDMLTKGISFDGSSIAGWKHIEKSDTLVRPDLSMRYIDPFIEKKTLAIHCDIHEPDGEPYNRDPRGIGRRAEAYLRRSGIGDAAYFGPEPEFFVFDSVRWNYDPSGCSLSIFSDEAAWVTGREYSEEHGPNLGHRPGYKQGYFPAPPVDSQVDLRNDICETLGQMGIVAEKHHHEVGTAGQGELGTRLGTLVTRGDHTVLQKYVTKNVALEHGKTATFMPKPISGDNGNGMHVHQSLFKAGKNLFMGDGYGGLSKTALHYIGGVLKHSQAINAFTNPTTNSYKRLVPGFEAPVFLVYSAHNRSASIRLPFVNNPKATRIEVRYPDCLANPYLAFAAMLMAGLDGIENEVDPGSPVDKNLYDLTPKEEKRMRKVSGALHDALNALDRDRGFLTRGGVFDDDMIDAYIELKRPEVMAFRSAPHPVEFDMYYSL